MYRFIFSLNVFREYLFVRGAVLLLSVLDYDKIGSDDFVGEVFIYLLFIILMEMLVIVDLKFVVMLSVKRFIF